jgi:hypothetical protein
MKSFKQLKIVNFKNIIIGVSFIPVILFSSILSFDSTFLNSIGVQNTKAASSNQIIPENSVYVISDQNGFAITASSFKKGVSNTVTMTKLNRSNVDQHFIWKKDPNNPDLGNFYSNGTSKLLSTRSFKISIEESNSSEIGYSGLKVQKGGSLNSFKFIAGICCGTPILNSQGQDKEIKVGGADYTLEQTLFYLTKLDVPARYVSTSGIKILENSKNYTFETSSKLAITAKNFRKTADNKIYAEQRTGPNEINQSFTWKANINELNKGSLLVTGTTKALTADNNGVYLEEYDGNPLQVFEVFIGFAPGSVQFRTTTCCNYSNITIPNSRTIEAEGKQLKLSKTSSINTDQTFFVKNPNPAKIVPVDNSNSTKATNQSLIASNLIFALTSTSDFAIDVKGYKNAKIKSVFSYPRLASNIEQHFKWVTTGSLNTGYLTLKGTDLTLVNSNGKLILQKLENKESQRFDVKKANNGTLQFVDRVSKKAITIQNQKAQSITLETYLPTNIKQQFLLKIIPK